MIHPYNAEQIENITGLTQGSLPEGFPEEYSTWLRMFHKSQSGGGALPMTLLIPLLRMFDIGMSTDEIQNAKRVQWNQVSPGTRVVARIGGYPRGGEFVQLVSGGTLGIKIDGLDRVAELPPADVQIDKTVHVEIDQRTMNDERGGPDARVKLIKDSLVTVPAKWEDIEPGSPVVVKVNGGELKDGTLIGPTPDSKGLLTVELDDGFENVPRDSVKLIETEPQPEGV